MIDVKFPILKTLRVLEYFQSLHIYRLSLPDDCRLKQVLRRHQLINLKSEVTIIYYTWKMNEDFCKYCPNTSTVNLLIIFLIILYL